MRDSGILGSAPAACGPAYGHVRDGTNTGSYNLGGNMEAAIGLKPLKIGNLVGEAPGESREEWGSA